MQVLISKIQNMNTSGWKKQVKYYKANICIRREQKYSTVEKFTSSCIKEY